MEIEPSEIALSAIPVPPAAPHARSACSQAAPATRSNGAAPVYGHLRRTESSRNRSG